MRLSSKLKQKIGDGTFREMWQEAKWMFKYIRRYRLVVLIHIVLGVVSTVMGLLSSIGMKRMIDVVTGFYYGGITGAAIYMVGMMIGSIVNGLGELGAVSLRRSPAAPERRRRRRRFRRYELSAQLCHGPCAVFRRACAHIVV